MSVNVTTYVLFGALLPYPSHLDDDKREWLCENHGVSTYDKTIREGVSYLVDGMGGEFCAAGLVVARSWRDTFGVLPSSVSIPRNPPRGGLAMVGHFVKTHSLNTDPLGFKVGWHIIPLYS